MKLSKTVEKLKILNIKPVTVEHPKTATKLSNPIKQSEIITHQVETIEKSNIHGHKISYYRTPRNCY